jgi:hydroxyethylthiazole kinase-like sugar kinase family protein
MNATDKVFAITTRSDITAMERIETIIEGDTEVLQTAVGLGCMLLLMMAQYGYHDAKDMWDDLAYYHDLRDS